MNAFNYQWKIKLLTTMLGLFFSGSLIIGMPMEGGAETFLPNTPSASYATMLLTPGQKAAQKQQEVLVEATFLEIFSQAEINKLDVDWSVFADPTTSFDHSAKRHPFKKINKFMKDCFSENYSNIKFNKLYSQVLAIEKAITSVPKERLEFYTSSYFTSLFPDASIKFLDKLEGDQLGCRVIIKKTPSESITYHVKTHAFGVKSSFSSAAAPVNARELMVYKILEGFTLGCESHFFGRDEKDLYIATRDANYDGRFQEYSKIDRKKREDTFPLWGALVDVLKESAEVNGTNHALIEAVVNQDDVAKNFIFQITMLDLLARLMLLTDLQTNGDNFGFIQADGSLPLLKVIDFRLHNTAEFKITDRDYGGFLAGNGFFHYASADEAVAYALKNRPRELRVKAAIHVFATTLQGWEQVIAKAMEATRKALQATGISELESERFSAELNSYTEDLKHNFKLFNDLLSKNSEAV